MSRPIYEIASEIRQNWLKVNFAAKPYLEAMETLSSIDDKFYADDATSIIAYFLSNATTWKGETARRIKKELNQLLKERA